jgi:site-specific DNA recombinase
VIRAAIYARISSDRDGDLLGVRRQVEDCERLIERKDGRSPSATSTTT